MAGLKSLVILSISIQADNAKDLAKDPLYKWLEQGGDWRKAHKLCSQLSIDFPDCVSAMFRLGSGISEFSRRIDRATYTAACSMLFAIYRSLGYKNYLTPDGSVNVWWVAILTAGEGWHNNHHAFPGSARSGLRRFEIDPSWLTLRLMKLIGLISWMRRRIFSE